MYYLDTSIIISYTDKKEKNHNKSVGIINDLHSGCFYISTYIVLELFCNICRNINKYSLIPGIRRGNRELDSKMILKYMIRKLNLKIESDRNEEELLKELNLKMFKKFFEAFKLAPYVSLPTGDSLNLIYAYNLKKEGKIKYLVSIDDHFRKGKDPIKTHTGIEIIFN